MFNDDFIPSQEKQDLFDNDVSDFQPPIIKNEQEDPVDMTPVLKFITPIKRKIKTPSPFSKPSFKTPVPDYSDEAALNKRVLTLINNSGDVNYDNEPQNVQDSCMDAFVIKYQNLTINYPDHNIKFPENKSVGTVHKHYHEVIKSIYVNMNLGQTQLIYILSLMVIEFLCVKVFAIPMSGFTKMELKRMYKYQSMMIELGEAMYPEGESGPPSPIEWRIASTFIWNIVVFIGIKIVSNYLGGEQMMDVIRNVVDKMLDNPITKDNIESGEAKNLNNEGEDLLGNLFSSEEGTGELLDLISNLGTSFTKKMENNKGGGKPSKKKRFIFND